MARAGGLKGDKSEALKNHNRFPGCGKVTDYLVGSGEKWFWGSELAAKGVG